MTASTLSPQLTKEERRAGFLKATRSMSGAAKRWKQRAASGLSDADLVDALTFELGIFGGCSGPGQLSLSYQGAGLKIWISHDVINHREVKPTFSGKATIAMAREVYGIHDPGDSQLTLF